MKKPPTNQGFETMDSDQSRSHSRNDNNNRDRYEQNDRY